MSLPSFIKSKILFISILFTINLQAQKQIETQQLVWARYHLQLKTNSPYTIKQEFGERAYWSPWRQHQFFSRTSIDRKLNKDLKASFGFSFFSQSLPHDPEAEITNNRSELRPHLGIDYKQKLSGKFSFHHRYWLEFRFLEQPEGNFEFGNYRTRYKFEVQYVASPKFVLKAFDEIHLNIGGNIVQNVFNQNRVGGSVLYKPIKNFGVELGYLNFFQQRSSGVDFFSRNIVRLTIRHTIDFKQNQ